MKKRAKCQIKIQNKRESEKKYSHHFLPPSIVFFFVVVDAHKLLERENTVVVLVANALQTPSRVRIARTQIKKCERKHGVKKDGVRVVEKC